MVSRRSFLLKLFAALSLCTGFADCSGRSVSVTYKISPCVPNSFELPNSVQDSVIKIEKLSFKGWENECRKLERYKVTRTEGKEAHQFEAYVRPIKVDRCSLFFTISFAGPKAPDETLYKAVDKLEADVPKLLLRNVKSRLQREHVEIIGGSGEYTEWCKKLPIPEILSK